MLSQSVTQFSVFVRDLTQSDDHLQIVTKRLLRFWTKMWMGFLAFEPPIPKILTPRTCTRACETLDVVA